jgi:hypothetical protein
MKKEYKKCGWLLYCYDPNTDFTVRIFKDGADVTTYGFKMSDWNTTAVYGDCTKKEFKKALSAAIKKLREVTK